MGGRCGRDRPVHDPATEDPARPAGGKRRSTSASTSSCSSRPSSSSSSREPSHQEDAPRPRQAGRRHSGRLQFIAHNPAEIGDEYEVGDKAGEGTQGVVFRAKRKKTGVMRAIKKVPKKNVNAEAFRREIAIMKMMDHPNIVKLFETFDDRGSTYLVMELCCGGELFDKVLEQGSFSECEAAIVLQQILRAVHYIHDKNIAHRDLKPENFMFTAKAPIDDENLLKLIDFGIACECGPSTILKEVVGTPYYVAPQVLIKKYDKACDIWSCGVIMYTLLTGNVPFSGCSDQEVLAKVREGVVTYRPQDWARVSEDGRALVRRLLTRNPKERYTAEQALNHDWIRLHAPRASARLQDSLVDNIRAFRRKNKLKQAALSIVAAELSDQQIRELRRTFTALDANNDGLLTYADIQAAVLKAGLQLPADLRELFDDGADGVLDYTEFLAATLDKKQHISEEACRMAFGMFDVDGTGRLTARDIARAFADASPPARRAAAQDIVDKYSTSGDGALDFDAFQRMIRSDDFSPPARRRSHSEDTATAAEVASFHTREALSRGEQVADAPVAAGAPAPLPPPSEALSIRAS